MCITYALAKRNVFIPSLKFSKFEFEQSSHGRLFQSLGAAAAKAKCTRDGSHNGDC